MTSINELKEVSRLEDIQRYVAEMEQDRGFAQHSVEDQCLRLGEEVGELFRAVRKHRGMSASIVGSVDEELADVLIYLCAIANRLGVDLKEALVRKEEYNETRSWPGGGRG